MDGYQKIDDGTLAAPDAQVKPVLVRIEEQSRQTLELVKALITLLVPKEGGREGPSLEELLGKLVALQREALAVGKATQADLARLADTLPSDVADALGPKEGGAVRSGRA